MFVCSSVFCICMSPCVLLRVNSLLLFDCLFVCVIVLCCDLV